MLQGIYARLRYWFQGASDIMQDHIWGNFDFDIINVLTHPSITRLRMRVRAALQRVWQSSWLQYYLDPSIRLGLNQDSREYVQRRQELADQDYLRRDNIHQKKRGLMFAMVGVVIEPFVAGCHRIESKQFNSRHEFLKKPTHPGCQFFEARNYPLSELLQKAVCFNPFQALEANSPTFLNALLTASATAFITFLQERPMILRALLNPTLAESMTFLAAS